MSVTATSSSHSTAITSSFISCGRYSRRNAAAVNTRNPTSISNVSTPSPDSSIKTSASSPVRSGSYFLDSSRTIKRSNSSKSARVGSESSALRRSAPRKKATTATKATKVPPKGSKRGPKGAGVSMMTKQRMPVFDKYTGSLTYMDVLMPVDDSGSFKVVPLRRSPRKHAGSYPKYPIFKPDGFDIPPRPYISPHNLAFPGSSPTREILSSSSLLSSSPTLVHPLSEQNTFQYSYSGTDFCGLEDAASRFAQQLKIHSSPVKPAHRVSNPGQLESPSFVHDFDSNSKPVSFFRDDDPLLNSPENSIAALMQQTTPVKSIKQRHSMDHFSQSPELTPLKSFNRQNSLSHLVSSPSNRNLGQDFSDDLFNDLFSTN